MPPQYVSVSLLACLLALFLFSFLSRTPCRPSLWPALLFSAAELQGLAAQVQQSNTGAFGTPGHQTPQQQQAHLHAVFKRQHQTLGGGAADMRTRIM